MDAEEQKFIWLLDEDEISTSSDGSSTLCTMCVEESDSTAVLYCDECQENLCEMCVFFHGRQKTTQNHELTHIENSGTSEIRYLLSDLEGEKTANSKMDDLFVKHISEEMDSKSLLFDRLIKRCDDVKMETNLHSQDISTEINSHFDKYIESLEKHRTELLKQTREMSTKHTEFIANQQSVLSSLQENVDEVKKILKTMTSGLGGSSGDWSRLSKLLMTIRQAKVHVTSPETTFCPDADGPIIDQYQFYGQIFSGHLCPAKCYIDCSGLETARVRQKALVILHTLQQEGKSFPCEAKVRVKILEPSGSLCKPKEVRNNMDGTWMIEFLPYETGKHVLHVTVDGQPIKTKSVVFNVKHGWREHTGRWHCCSVCSENRRNDEPCDYCCNHDSVVHPGGPHWTCCGKLTKHSECDTYTWRKRRNQTSPYNRPLSKCSFDLSLMNSVIKEVTL
ncbi:E3 ubiquitin-protein ligase TRIM45-like isoform X2 [Saccostrea cucullata]|uniref:E3 ubiquitin-protein ligase TRIM45-like isoform X2 n=1 Tax=Saccostrea cuccullata TaxID=36930 RepID=UPI002ED5CF7B